MIDQRRLLCLAVTVLTLCCCPAQEPPAQHPSAYTADSRLVSTVPESGHFVLTQRGYMVPYTDRIPGTDVTFEMVPVPGVAARGQMQPFWIGKYEVTLAEYAQFMKLNGVFRTLVARKERLVSEENLIDSVTAATELYIPQERFAYANSPNAPAASMTRYGARQYTKWLSLISGRQYRLPTVGEWTQACRAGTKTRWSFGDDPAVADQYCVCRETSSKEGPENVGSRKPNAWGIHDMHGNVTEWVLDERTLRDHRTLNLDLDVFPNQGRGIAILKGGSWLQPLQQCRTTSSEYADWDELCREDPDLPQSPHWLANFDEMSAIGFRIISPLNEHSRDELEMHWGPDCQRMLWDIETQLKGGRGARGLVDPRLPEITRQIEQGQRRKRKPLWAP